LTVLIIGQRHPASNFKNPGLPTGKITTKAGSGKRRAEDGKRKTERGRRKEEDGKRKTEITLVFIFQRADED
jgi:hypothetical protein